MDLVTFLRVLLRRWDVVLPGFLLTVVTVLSAGANVAPEFEAEGSLLLLGPSTSTSSQGAVPVNPYLNIPSSLDSTAVIIAETMRSQETIRELANLGATADYEVEATQKTPILTVTTRGSSREQVLHTAQLVLRRAQDDLARRQQEAGAPEQAFIRSEVLTPPRASMHSGSKPRVMAAVGALGLGLTVLLAFAVENLAAWLIRRRRAETAPTSIGGAPTFAGMPFVSSEPAPHPNSAREAAHGNGWQPHPPSGPLVDVAVDRAEPALAEDPSERVGVEEVPAKDEVAANEVSAHEVSAHEVSSHELSAQDVVPADNGTLEQQDGLVDAWWTAWERRQAGRRAAHAPLVESTAYDPEEDRAWEAEEAGNKDAAKMSPPEATDGDEEFDAMLDEDLRGTIGQAPINEQAERVVAWGGQIEVLGGTPRVERGTPGTWPYVGGGDGSVDRSGT